MKRTSEVEISLANMLEGGVIAMFDGELERLKQNVMDLNTKATAPRKIVLTVKFSPDEDREMVAVDATVELKLAGRNAVVGKAIVGQDIHGNIEIRELVPERFGPLFEDHGNVTDIATRMWEKTS